LFIKQKDSKSTPKAGQVVPDMLVNIKLFVVLYIPSGQILPHSFFFYSLNL